MKMDFSGLPPRTKTFEEAQEIIHTLWEICCGLPNQVKVFEARCQMLEEANALLKKRVSELEEKLNTNSRNSSNPPSSDKPNPKNPNAQSNHWNKESNRNRGGQQGHEGHARKPLPPEEVDKFVVCDPAKQCACGGLVHKTGGV